MTAATLTRRFLRSPILDVLVGPHGIDRYLELIRPDLTVHDARAEVLAVRHQTPRSVTLTLRPNAAWTAGRAGQFVRVGVEIDGVRRTRTYSPATSRHAPDGLIELTVTRHRDGLVSTYLADRIRPGMIVHLGAADGDFELPDRRPDRLLLLSGGSGITPVMAMLRTLCDEGHRGEVAFIHYARTAGDWLYRAETEALAARHPNVRVRYLATREGAGHLHAAELTQLIPDFDPSQITAAVCGPPALVEAAGGIWSDAPARLLTETFTAPVLTATGVAAEGTLQFATSGMAVPIGEGTLLEQAEAAGLSPEFGCRMGICHTCTCRKRAGAVRNVLTGAVSSEDDEDIQLCISVPAGDVALDL